MEAAYLVRSKTFEIRQMGKLSPGQKTWFLK